MWCIPNGTVGLDAFRYVPLSAFLGDRGRQLGTVRQPLLQLLNGVDGPVLQLPEQRFDLRPIPHGRPFWNELPGKRTARINLHQTMHRTTPLDVPISGKCARVTALLVGGGAGEILLTEPKKAACALRSRRLASRS